MYLHVLDRGVSDERPLVHGSALNPNSKPLNSHILPKPLNRPVVQTPPSRRRGCDENPHPSKVRVQGIDVRLGINVEGMEVRG